MAEKIALHTGKQLLVDAFFWAEVGNARVAERRMWLSSGGQKAAWCIGLWERGL